MNIDLLECIFKEKFQCEDDNKHWLEQKDGAQKYNMIISNNRERIYFCNSILEILKNKKNGNY